VTAAPKPASDFPLFRRQWRETVSDGDLVYVVADRAADGLDGLPGAGALVSGVERVRGAFLLSPLPLHPSLFGDGAVNLHGRSTAGARLGPGYLCIAPEATHLRPLALGEAEATLRGGGGLPPLPEPYWSALWNDRASAA
jgi:hypothetical protein